MLSCLLLVWSLMSIILSCAMLTLSASALFFSSANLVLSTSIWFLAARAVLWALIPSALIFSASLSLFSASLPRWWTSCPSLCSSSPIDPSLLLSSSSLPLSASNSSLELSASSKSCLAASCFCSNRLTSLINAPLASLRRFSSFDISSTCASAARLASPCSLANSAFSLSSFALPRSTSSLLMARSSSIFLFSTSKDAHLSASLLLSSSLTARNCALSCIKPACMLSSLACSPFSLSLSSTFWFLRLLITSSTAPTEP
mmetsp:Transcript_671/g.1168  ORF Transcript_671/g.1168 Transcript_671/m.1168 type:complete len:259 (-) Transcript_671:424-1200(-)